MNIYSIKVTLEGGGICNIDNIEDENSDVIFNKIFKTDIYAYRNPETDTLIGFVTDKATSIIVTKTNK